MAWLFRSSRARHRAAVGPLPTGAVQVHRTVGLVFTDGSTLVWDAKDQRAQPFLALAQIMLSAEAQGLVALQRRPQPADSTAWEVGV